jgi:hypothetical protein
MLKNPATFIMDVDTNVTDLNKFVMVLSFFVVVVDTTVTDLNTTATLLSWFVAKKRNLHVLPPFSGSLYQ